MSGIEIVGLLLGTIPLVISALEHYDDIIDPTRAFVKFQGELDRAIRELRNQHTLFEQSIEMLLRPISTLTTLRTIKITKISQRTCITFGKTSYLLQYSKLI